jgi:hypothetical protein
MIRPWICCKLSSGGGGLRGRKKAPGEDRGALGNCQCAFGTGVVAGRRDERLARKMGIRDQNGTDHRRQSHRAQSVPRRKWE